jgi:hypothetical protein
MNLSILLDSVLFTACAAVGIIQGLCLILSVSTEMLFNRKVLFLVLETAKKMLKLFMRIAIYHHLQS